MDNFEARIAFHNYTKEEKLEYYCNDYGAFIEALYNFGADPDITVIGVQMEVYAEERGCYKFSKDFKQKYF